MFWAVTQHRLGRAFGSIAAVLAGTALAVLSRLAVGRMRSLLLALHLRANTHLNNRGLAVQEPLRRIVWLVRIAVEELSEDAGVGARGQCPRPNPTSR